MTHDSRDDTNVDGARIIVARDGTATKEAPRDQIGGTGAPEKTEIAGTDGVGKTDTEESGDNAAGGYADRTSNVKN